MPDLSGHEDYSRFHVHEPNDGSTAVDEEEAPLDSPALAPLPAIQRAPSPDDFVDSPRDFDEAGLTDEAAE